jgi:hypothetical protein
MDRIRSLFGGAAPPPVVPKDPRYNAPGPDNHIKLAETQIKEHLTALREHQGPIDSHRAAGELQMLSNMWKQICDHSLGLYNTQDISYASKGITKDALEILTRLERGLEDPRSEHKPVIASFRAQLEQMEKEVSSLRSTLKTQIYLNDGSFVTRIVPLERPRDLPRPMAAPVATPLPRPPIDHRRATPAERIQNALFEPEALHLQQLKGLLYHSSEIIRQNPPDKELLVSLYTLVSKLSPADFNLLLEDRDVGNLAKELLYNSFDAMHEQLIQLSTRPLLLPSFCTYFHRVFSLPDFEFHPSKERMLVQLENFLIYYGKNAPPEAKAEVHNLFMEVFNRSLQKENRAEMRALFTAYEEFATRCTPDVHLYDRLTLLHLTNKFPDIGASLESKLSKVLKDWDSYNRQLYAQKNLGILSKDRDRRDQWKVEAQQDIQEHLTYLIQPSEGIDIDELANLYAKIDLFRRYGDPDVADRFSLQLTQLAKTLRLKDVPLTEFNNAWHSRLEGLENRYKQSLFGTDLESLESDTLKLLLNANSLFHDSYTRPEQALFSRNINLLGTIRAARFQAASDSAVSTITGNFDHRAHWKASIMIAGYTARAMLQGTLHTPNDLDRAMFKGISRYTADPTSGLRAMAPLIQTQPGRSFLIPEKDQALTWKAHLEWLENKRTDDQAIAAVVTKGSNAFSLMINPEGSVTITSSDPQGNSLLKTFDSIDKAALFLSALYRHIPRRSGENAVEFIPVTLAEESDAGKELEAADEDYAARQLRSARRLDAQPRLDPLPFDGELQPKHIQIIRDIAFGSAKELEAATGALYALDNQRDQIAKALRRADYLGIDRDTGPQGEQMIDHLRTRAKQLLAYLAQRIPVRLEGARPLPEPKTQDEQIVDFYNRGAAIPAGNGNCSGFTFDQIIDSFSHRDLAAEDTLIDWLFPTAYTNASTLGRIKANPHFRERMQASLDKMIYFYGGIPERDASGKLLRISPSTGGRIRAGDPNPRTIIASLELHGLSQDAAVFLRFAKEKKML